MRKLEIVQPSNEREEDTLTPSPEWNRYYTTFNASGRSYCLKLAASYELFIYLEFPPIDEWGHEVSSTMLLGDVKNPTAVVRRAYAETLKAIFATKPPYFKFSAWEKERHPLYNRLSKRLAADTGYVSQLQDGYYLLVKELRTQGSER